MDVAERSNLEVADGDAREARRRRPLLAGGHPSNDVDAVQMVVGRAEEAVEEEQLAEHVDEVDDLDEQVGDGEEAAAGRARADAPPARRLRAAADTADLEQEAGRVTRHVALGLLGGGGVRRLPSGLDRRIGNVVDGDARLSAEHAPDGTRQVEEQCLTGEEEGHPLVIADVRLRVVLAGKFALVPRYVVGVRSPADLQQPHPQNTPVLRDRDRNVHDLELDL